MSYLRFNDGVKFDTSGDLRMESRSDGVYVVGKGMLIPVNDEADAERTIKILKETSCRNR
jgi:CRISPR/Cas system CMR-associated protein Cmr3 (group 5 of RAMP superfamily)